MYLVLILGLCVCASCVVATQNITNRTQDNSDTHSVHKATWIARPLMDALWAFTPNSTSNPLCQAQSFIYLRHLKEGSLWAVQMLESSALAPLGVLSGNTHQLGQFDECIGLDVPKYKLRGKYCLPKIQFRPEQQAYPDFYLDTFHFDPYDLYYNPELPVWDKIKVTPDPSKHHRDELLWGVCVPSACTTEDVLLSLNRTLTPVFNYYGINGSVQLEDKMCHTEEPYSLGFKILSGLIGFTFFIVLAATIYDVLVYKNSEASKLPKGKLIKVILSYSIYRNLINLKKPDSSSDLAVMHGMRTYSMFLIILGHRCMFSYGSPIHNPPFLENRYRRFEDTFLLNGTIIVDTFFILSGFLTCYMTYIELEKRRRLRIFAMYIYRWLRITPSYMIMVAFYAFILPQIGDGPLWQAKAGLEAERCQQNWWANLLFINNYVNANNLCLFQSWFITCDMHYFLVAPFIVHLLWKHPRVGKTFLFILFCLATLTPTLVTYYKGYDGILKVYTSLLEDPNKNEQYINFYIKSHNRAIPYILGMATAYLYFHLKAVKFQMSGVQVRFGGIMSTILALSALMVAFVFYIPGFAISPIFNALYSSLHRVVWALPMCWLIIAGGLKGFGVLDRILTLRVLVPLSRLTYCAFLVHTFIQLYSVATIRNPQYMSFPVLLWMAFGDIAASFIMALFLHLLVEAPIASIQKMILKPNNTYVHKPKDIKPETNLAFTTEPPPTTLHLNNLEPSPNKLPSIDTHIEHERL